MMSIYITSPNKCVKKDFLLTEYINTKTHKRIPKSIFFHSSWSYKNQQQQQQYDCWWVKSFNNNNNICNILKVVDFCFYCHRYYTWYSCTWLAFQQKKRKKNSVCWLYRFRIATPFFHILFVVVGTRILSRKTFWLGIIIFVVVVIYTTTKQNGIQFDWIRAILCLNGVCE